MHLLPSCLECGQCYVRILLFSHLLHSNPPDAYFIAGLAASVNDYTSPSWEGWIRLYNLTFIIGLAISGVLFWILSVSFPPPGLHQESDFIMETPSTVENYQTEEQANGARQTKEKESLNSGVVV